jgi:hypothetical protein
VVALGEVVGVPRSVHPGDAAGPARAQLVRFIVAQRFRQLSVKQALSTSEQQAALVQ